MARYSWFGLILVASVAVVAAFAVAPWSTLWGQPPRTPAGMAASDLIVLPGSATAGGQRFIVVDLVNRVMGSYSVAEPSGEIALKSVRNFSWDLYLEDFNTPQPAPREIKDLLEKNH